MLSLLFRGNNSVNHWNAFTLSTEMIMFVLFRLFHHDFQEIRGFFIVKPGFHMAVSRDHSKEILELPIFSAYNRPYILWRHSMPVTTTLWMHCILDVKISSYSFQTKTFLTHHSPFTIKVSIAKIDLCNILIDSSLCWTFRINTSLKGIKRDVTQEK